tara:strand:+ start:208 stop:579 length:372 start_codon:yes stop_codon:yes gene_type:complete
MSKKILFLFIAITSFTNVSYASFPIIDTLQIKQDALQTETVAQYHLRMQKMGFDINDCRCDDCKIFKGINTPLKNGEVRRKQKTNVWPLVKTLGIWIIAVSVILGIWLIVAFFNAITGLGIVG